jgi:hypothetical protein
MHDDRTLPLDGVPDHYAADGRTIEILPVEGALDNFAAQGHISIT